MFTREQKSSIKSLMQSPYWDVLLLVRNSICDQLAYEPKGRETGDDTLRTVYRLEGNIEGIKRFFSELDKLALTSTQDV